MDQQQDLSNVGRSAPQPAITDRIIHETCRITQLLKETVWPKRSADAVHCFVGALDSITQIINRKPEGHSISDSKDFEYLEKLARALESVFLKVQDASDTYGAKKRTFGRKVKYLFSYLDWDQCINILDACRQDVENALDSLNTNGGHEKGTVASEPSLTAVEAKPAAPTKSSQLGPTGAASLDTSASARPDQQESDSGRRKWNMATRKTLDLIQVVSGTIPVVGSYLGAAAQVGLAVVSTLQNMDSNQEVSKELESSTSRLVGLLERLDKKTVERNKEETTSYINDMIGQLKTIQSQVEKLNSSSTFSRVMSADEHADALKGHQETIKAALEEIQLLVSLNTTDLLREIYDAELRKEQRRLLNCLGDANYGAKGDSIEDVICLPGTRTKILERMDEWMRNTQTSERVLWIRGTAGRGKSTIASTVAYRWRYRAACGVFYFRRGQNSLDKRLICALARQLGSSGVPEIKESVLKTIKENEDIAQDRLQEQFKTLLVTSLERLEDKTVPVLLVVDALDECESSESAINFVKLIDRFLPSLPANVKFLLTSRPEAPLMRALEPRPWHAEDLDSVTEVDEDIEQFVRFGLSKVKSEYDLGDDWPLPNTVPTLVRMAQGLFQWAYTAIQYMMEGSPQLRLEELLLSPSVCDGLDSLYLQILSKAFKKADKSPSRESILLRTLGALVVSPYPISLEVMAFIFTSHEMFHNKSQENIILILRQEVLVDLASLIRIPRQSTTSVQLVHTSVRDLLVDRKRCGDVSCWIDVENNHHYLSSTYLRLMNRDLTANICGLTDLSKANTYPDVQDLVKLHVPRGLQHCCRSWSIHLATCAFKSETGHWDLILAELEIFSKKKLLGWLEVMSIIGETRESLVAAKAVKKVLQTSTGISNPLLEELWSDTCRFIIVFHEPISFGILHIYASALPYCPSETALWKCYSQEATTCVKNGTRDLTWPSELWSRHIATGIYSAVISPNGDLIAFGSADERVWLWNLESGAPTGQPLEGHSAAVSSVVFSPDGKLLASGSYDKTIRLWNVETTTPHGPPLEGHDGTIFYVAFSPDGQMLASGSADKTIRLWDVETGLAIGEPLTGHGDTITSVAFSPRGALLASGSIDNTVRLWDPKTGRLIGQPLYGHTAPVHSVAFSPTGNILASGSADRTLRLWDPYTASPLGEPLRRHVDDLNVVVFSPDGKFLASGSRDTTIRLWDVETSSPMGAILGHARSLNSAAFSPDGKTLVSGSMDDTIRLWDLGPTLVSGYSLPKAQSFDESANWEDDLIAEGFLAFDVGSVRSVAIAPNGNIVASASDYEIHLWDIETGETCGEPLSVYPDTMSSVALSPNGKVIAGTSQETLRLWHVANGETVREPLPCNDTTNFITFSPDGGLLVVETTGGDILLWSTETWEFTGEPLRTGNTGGASTGTFLPDVSNGRILVVGCGDLIQFWHTDTRAKLGERELGLDAVRLSFLPDGQLICTTYADMCLLLDYSGIHPSLTTSVSATDEDIYKSCLTSSQPIPLGGQGGWVMILSHRLLWLPQQYRIHAWGQRNFMFLLRDRLVVPRLDKIFFFDVARGLAR